MTDIEFDWNWDQFKTEVCNVLAVREKKNIWIGLMKMISRSLNFSGTKTCCTKNMWVHQIKISEDNVLMPT